MNAAARDPQPKSLAHRLWSRLAVLVWIADTALAELLLGLWSVWWGVWVLRHKSFSEDFSVQWAVGTEPVIGPACIVIGIGQIIASLAGNRKARIFFGLLHASIFALILMIFGLVSWRYTSTPSYGTAAIFSLLITCLLILRGRVDPRD